MRHYAVQYTGVTIWDVSAPTPKQAMAKVKRQFSKPAEGWGAMELVTDGGKTRIKFED